MLTPIKIAGKNTRDNRKKAIAERKALQRPPGRPLKLPVSDTASQSSTSSTAPIKKPKKRTMQNMKSRRKMSLLEKLPTELLKEVFIYSMNLELPRSSPIIGGKLSSEIVYLYTLMAAFGPTWKRWHGIVGERDLDHQQRVHALYLAQGVEDGFTNGDPQLQSTILRCRWASLTRLLEAKELWIQTYARDRVWKPTYFMLDQDVSSETSGNDTVPTMTAREYFEKDFDGFSAYAQRDIGEDLWDYCTMLPTYDVASGVEIPDSLLLGPWTEEMIRFLFWLTRSGWKIDWLNSTSGELALEGLKTAISKGNLRAIFLLVWAGVAEKLDIETVAWAFRNGGGDKIATVSQILRMGEDYNAKDCRKFLLAVRRMIEEAREQSDKAMLDFLEEIKHTDAFSKAFNWCSTSRVSYEL